MALKYAFPTHNRDWLHFRIKFHEEYAVEENGNRKVAYAEKQEIMDGIIQKYHPDWMTCEDIPSSAMPAGGQRMTMGERREHQRTAGRRWASDSTKR